MSPHDSSVHAPAHEHAVGEAYPRGTLRDLIGAELHEEEKRGRWQGTLIAFGLALLALGLPTESLMGEGPDLVRWTDGATWIHVHLLLLPATKILALLPGLHSERAWFLLSALCWAGTFPVLVSLCQGLGFPRLHSVLGAVFALTAPVAWLAGTLPGPAAPGLLGGALLLRALMGPWMVPESPWSRTTPQRTILFWLLACGLNLTLALTLPAVIWSLYPRSRPGDDVDRAATRGRASAVIMGPLVLAATLLLCAWLPGATYGGTEFIRRAWYVLTGDVQRQSPAVISWLFVLVPSLGVGALGLLYLAQRPRAVEESRPPSWLVGWCAFPFLFQIIIGRPKLDLPTLILVPVISIGVAAWIASWTEGPTVKRVIAFAGSQAALLLAFCLALAHSNPDLPWMRLAQRRLAASDLVLTRSRTHHYLLRNRFSVRALDLSEPTRLSPDQHARWWSEARARVEAATAERRRVVLDWKQPRGVIAPRAYPFEPELHRLLLLAPIVELDEEQR